jgi:trigger factor
MQVLKTQLSDTTIKLAITGDEATLESIKQQVLNDLKKKVKLPGFREGKVPLELVERNLDPNVFQNEFLDLALNRLYAAALDQERIRPVAQPKVNLTKFVPFTTLEFDAELEAIGAIKLPDYTKISVPRKAVKVTDKQVDEVIESLRLRMAEKKTVDRAAKDKDEIWIDFAGVDAKTKEPISGGEGNDYPLILGSNTFIPGFEDKLIGVKPGEEREFTLEFPKDYGVKALQGRKVTFKVTTTKVQEVVLPKVDDEFAAKAGPFQTVTELREDVKKQLAAEDNYQAQRDYESDLLAAISDKTEVAIPKSLVDEELDRVDREERQNLAYRGQTWQEHLAAEGVSEEEHREKNRAGAELRVKAGLILADIAEKENIQLTPQELDMQIELLKGQYQDDAMRSEIDKPENRREIASRMLTEKTISRLSEYSEAADKAKKPSAKKS